MRDVSAESGHDLYPRSISQRTRDTIPHVALYSAFAIIAAVVFGTLSYHPF